MLLPQFRRSWEHLRHRKEKIRMSDSNTGVVKWFSTQKGFGFITPDDGSDDVFAHFSNIEGTGIRNLYEGKRVEFKIENGPKGLNATEIVSVD